MKYFLIAGERSGDLHGGNLIKALYKTDSEAEVVCYGGDYMQSAGAHLIKHYRDTSFMGFLEVIQNLGKIKKVMNDCKKDISEQQPDVLILIDFPGFNLRMAKFAKEIGIRTAYYISPKIWAWKKGRIKQIKKFVDRMFVIFPFEVPFYRELEYDVTFVGNPLVEYISNYSFSPIDFPDNVYQNKIAFLPGSRIQEIKTSIPFIIELAQKRPNDLLMVAAVNNVDQNLYEGLKSLKNIVVLEGKTYEILKAADVSITTSGTATLETALMGTPQMVCYRTSEISYRIAKTVVNISYISLVNLIADQPVVKEYIQHEYSIENIQSELQRILSDGNYRKQMLDNYSEIRKLLTEESASENTAQELIHWLGRS